MTRVQRGHLIVNAKYHKNETPYFYLLPQFFIFIYICRKYAGDYDAIVHLKN